MTMRAVVLNCTLKPAPESSNTELLAKVVIDALADHGVQSSLIRVVDRNVLPGVLTDQGPGDGWPAIHDEILDAEILIIATPTWVAQPSSVAKQVIERMDAMLSETDDDGRPVAFNRVAGFVVTGNEDGAHHVIAELTQAVTDVGFTVPGQAFTYWNMGPGPGPDYSDTDHGHEYSASTGRAAAANLVAVARALAVTPIPAPPS
jgi:multimeric flavodoxin WrbA